MKKTEKPHCDYSPSHNEVVFLEEKRMLFHIRQDLPCYPFWFENVIREKNAWYDSSPVPYAMFVLGLEGTTRYEIHNKDFMVTPGTLLFIPEFTSFRFSSNGRMAKCLLEIKGSNLASILTTFGFQEERLINLDGDSEVFQNMRAVADKLESHSESGFLDAMGLTYRFLAHLSFLQKRKKQNDSQFQKILNFLEQDFTLRITLNDVCSYVKMSPSTLTRLVKQQIGMTPMQYRLKRKQERATYFLYMKEMTIKEIAYRLGYSSPFHFSRDFKLHTGLSPLLFRAEQHRMRENSRDVDLRKKKK